jgi:ABC-type multidrug transport system fused ATPase/permease subunit
MNNTFLPPALETVICKERIDFSVFSKRKQPVSKSLGILFFGTFWSAITSIFVVAFFGDLFKGGEISFYVNETQKTASLDDPQSLLIPALLIGVFVLIGIGTLLYGFYTFFQKGGYFVGTASRLLHYRNGNIKSFDWEQFTGNIEMNHKRGNLTLQLRTGKMVSRKNSSATFVPDIVYISGVPNVLEIEKICRKRINEQLKITN